MKLDYWMIEVLQKSLTEYVKNHNLTKIWKENRNRWNDLGKVRLTQERLNEIQQEYDNEIKEGLGIG